MYKTTEDEMVICPYNRSHCVSKLRIQKHLMKCQKSHPNVKLAVCFYNYSHRVPPEDLLEHYKVCPQKNTVEAAHYSEQDLPKGADYQYSDFQDFTVTTNSSIEGEKSDSLNFEKLSFKVDKSFVNESNTDEELEPLPLPKTVSKAFVCGKQTTGDVSDTKPKLLEEKDF